MTTTCRAASLRGWLVRGGAAVLVLAFCGSALADPSKNVVTPAKKTVRVTKKHAKCYTWVTGYGMPIPCEQIRCPIATTSHPLYTIGNKDTPAN